MLASAPPCRLHQRSLATVDAVFSPERPAASAPRPGCGSLSAHGTDGRSAGILGRLPADAADPLRDDGHRRPRMTRTELVASQVRPSGQELLAGCLGRAGTAAGTSRSRSEATGSIRTARPASRSSLCLPLLVDGVAALTGNYVGRPDSLVANLAALGAVLVLWRWVRAEPGRPRPSGRRCGSWSIRSRSSFTSIYAESLFFLLATLTPRRERPRSTALAARASGAGSRRPRVRWASCWRPRWRLGLWRD